jgi:hypothetical protein
MSVALLLQLGAFLVQNGPQFVKDVEAIKAAGTAKPEDIAQLEAMIETMDTQRMASWAAADKALS